MACADELEATRLILGPAAGTVGTVLHTLPPTDSAAATLLDAWLPLPFSIGKMDMV